MTTPEISESEPIEQAAVDFSVYDLQTGRVLRTGWMMDEASALVQAGAGEAVHLGLVPPSHYIGPDGPTPISEQPSDDHAFDWASHTWQLRSMPDLRADASVRIDAEYSAATVAISAGYPLEERESWPVQTSEARALMADPEAVTPWIAAAAQARGLTPANLAQRIILLDDAYRAVHGHLSGTRQQLQRQITAAATPEELSLAVWPTTFEGSP